jgi:hypothetical protein
MPDVGRGDGWNLSIVGEKEGANVGPIDVVGRSVGYVVGRSVGYVVGDGYGTGVGNFV